MPRSNARQVLADNVRALMRDRGLTAPEVESKCGVSRSTVNYVRNNNINTSVGTVQDLARGFSLPPWALLVPQLDVRANGQDLADLISRYLQASSDGRRGILRNALVEATLAKQEGDSPKPS